jgi:hypothetical protein
VDHLNVDREHKRDKRYECAGRVSRPRGTGDRSTTDDLPAGQGHTARFHDRNVTRRFASCSYGKSLAGGRLWYAGCVLPRQRVARPPPAQRRTGGPAPRSPGPVRRVCAGFRTAYQPRWLVGFRRSASAQRGARGRAFCSRWSG